MNYKIYNDKNDEQYFRQFKDYETCYHWVVNHLDLSLNWNIERNEMTLQEIKKAVLNGQVVNWANDSYVVVFDSLNQWLIECTLNGHCIGLTHLDGVTMNGKKSEFYTTKKGNG